MADARISKVRCSSEQQCTLYVGKGWCVPYSQARDTRHPPRMQAKRAPILSLALGKVKMADRGEEAVVMADTNAC
jgi:hypothetical protein